jgi:hypothetical protein
MNTIEIPEINFKREIASEINEMTDDEFVYFASLCHRFASKEISLSDLKTAMVIKMLGIKNKGFDSLAASTKFRISENMAHIAELLSFLFDEDENGLTYNLNFTRNFIPVIRLRPWLKLKGPAAALTDITFLQYKDANTHYRAFQESQNESDLNSLIAVLYRPVYFGIGKKYKPERAARFTRVISRMPIAIRWGIFLFYAACERYLRYGTIEVDGQEIDLEILYTETLIEKQKGKKPKYDNKAGLAGVALSLAGTGIFGSIEKVYEQNLYDVLVLLYKQRIEYLNSLEQ